VGGRRPAEELDEQPLRTGVLVGQRGQNAALGEHPPDALVVVVLVEDLLQRPLAEAAAEEVVEVGVVELAGDGEGAEAEQAQGVAGHFPVAEVPGRQHQRPARQELVHERPALVEVEVAPPGADVHGPRQLHDVDQEPAAVPVDGPDPRVALAGVEFREGVPEVVVGDLAVPGVDAVRQPRQPDRQPGRRTRGQCLQDAHGEAHGDIGEVVGEAGTWLGHAAPPWAEDEAIKNYKLQNKKQELKHSDGVSRRFIS
jgi:hypothetical protein